MFDKLIVTEPEGADFRNRRSYFMVSSLIVGLLFITAVVISIYAADYGLGSDSFELSMVVAPPDIANVEPKSLQPRTAANPSQSQSSSLIKPSYVAPISDSRSVPQTISTIPGAFREWRSSAAAPAGSDSAGPTASRGTGDGPIGLDNSTGPTEASSVPDPPQPPAIKKPVEEKPKAPVTGGVVNGKATYLPKPPYPAAAAAINVQGKVDVAVTIDENGKVIAANAVSGHPLLKAAAERAAWNAKFSTTYLSKVPVKVTGIIVYNFSR